jgi:hypothetical protein
MDDVLDMPYDAMLDVVKSAERCSARERQMFCVDVAMSVASLFSGKGKGKGLKDHLKNIAPEK